MFLQDVMIYIMILFLSLATLMFPCSKKKNPVLTDNLIAKIIPREVMSFAILLVYMFKRRSHLAETELIGF